MATRREEVKVTADVSNFVTKMSAAGVAANKFAANLEGADQKMGSLVQSSLALAPALVPLGAAALPAVAGLATQLGFAALAAGTAALAFHGIGDGLSALDAAQLDPSVANLEKLRAAMDKLGPAGQEFVLALDKMKPAVKGLQNLAQAGLFPGVTAGLDELMGLMPQLQDIIYTTATALGDLAAAGGQELAGPRFQEFFAYLQTTARPILTEMGETFGNFVAGIANLVVAFDPLSRSFSTGLLGMSQAFRDWSAQLSSSTGFQEFVSYVQAAGPAALDALESIGNAFIQLVEAAAPVGSAVLPVISALADGLAALADSSVGPILITTAAAVGVLGRSLALLNAVGLRGAGGGIVGNAIGVDKIKTSLPTLSQAGTYLGKLGQSAERASAKTLAARESVRNFGKAVGPAAGVAAGLAVATTGVGDKMGVANTASLALMGTIAGPWGAAIGGGVGLALDLAAANNDIVDATKAANQTLSAPLDLEGQLKSLEELNTAVHEYFDTDWFSLGDAWRNISDVWTNAGDEAVAAREKIAASTQNLELNLQTLSYALNGNDWSKFNIGTADQVALATKLAPALQRAGIDAGVLNHEMNLVTRNRVTDAWRDYVGEMDSVAGQSRSVGDAIAALGNSADTAAAQADTLKTALDGLFGIQLSQSAATDAAVNALRDMRKALKGANGDLLSNSKVALGARDATRSYVQAQLDKADADARADGNGRKVAQTLLATRDSIVATAKAAGASKGQIDKLVAAMGLTPKNLTTIIETSNVLSAQEKVKALIRLYSLTPKQVKTIVSEAGSAPTQKKIIDLAKKYDLTPKEVHTLLSATDAASAKAKAAKAQADKLKADFRARLLATDLASGVIRGALNNLALFNGRTATATVTTKHKTLNEVTNSVVNVGSSLFGPKKATGGYVSGPGTSVSDSIHARLSDGEYVIKAAAVAKYGMATFDRLNAMKYADGGPVGQYATRPSTSRSTGIDYEKLAGAVQSNGQTVNLNGPITTMDVNAMARAVERRANVAASMARQP